MIDFDLNISKEGSNLRPASKHNSLSCIDSRYNAVRRCLSTKSTVLACSKHLYCRTIYSYNLIWIGSIYYNVGDNISKSIMDIYGNDYTLHTSGYVIFTIKYTFPHNVNTLQISRKSNKTDILPLHVRVANWDRIFGRFLLRQYIRDVLAETGNSGGAGWNRIFRRCWLRQDIREVLAETGYSGDACWDSIFGRCLLRQDIREVFAETGYSGGSCWDSIFGKCLLRQYIREVLAETGYSRGACWERIFGRFLLRQEIR